MKNEKTPIINILTYKLPFELANQIYNEFQNRLKEANHLIDNYKNYKSLKNDTEVVELILSLSIFHRKVISNLDGAVKFYGTVSTKSQADTITIGNYKLTGDEKNKILAVVINYNQLIEKFSIPPDVMEYYETRDFLNKLINLKTSLKYAQRQNRRKDDEDKIPF